MPFSNAQAILGGTIILACRDKTKGTEAVNLIKAQTNNQNVEFGQLDLASLKSIKEFADTFKAKYDHLDILINNAGTRA
jgi:NAD(P)-dependent dehydrogenase (short-subunit alcohol dehydrogenase family)